MCKPLWDQRNITWLVARVLTLNPELSAELVTDVYTIVAQCRGEDPVYWEAGMPTIKLTP